MNNTYSFGFYLDRNISRINYEVIIILTFFVIIVIYSNIPISTLDRRKYRQLFSVKPSSPSYMITNAHQQVNDIKQDTDPSKTK